MAQADFDGWSELYQRWLDIDAGDDTADTSETSFLRRIIDEVGGPVAELGVGTGRVAARVRPEYGVDISAAMIAASGAVLDATQLIEGDIAAVRLPEAVGVQYCAQNTLNHVADGRQADVFITAGANSLPKGVLVLDVALRVESRLRARDRLPVLRARSDSSIIWDVTRARDARYRCAEVHGILDTVDASGVVASRRYFPAISFVFLSVAEIVGWAAQAGWALSSSAADYDGTPLSAESPAGVFVFGRTS